MCVDKSNSKVILKTSWLNPVTSFNVLPKIQVMSFMVITLLNTKRTNNRVILVLHFANVEI